MACTIDQYEILFFFWMNATRVNLCICRRMHWRGATEGIQSERFGNSPGRVSNLPTEHLAGAGLALPPELSSQQLLLPQGNTLAPIPDLSPGPGAQCSQRTLVQPGKSTSPGTLHRDKAHGALPSPPRVGSAPLMECPGAHWASAFWNWISGKQEWKELNFDKEKTSELLACSPKLNRINLEAQQPAQSSHKKKFFYC